MTVRSKFDVTYLGFSESDRIPTERELRLEFGAKGHVIVVGSAAEYDSVLTACRTADWVVNFEPPTSLDSAPDRLLQGDRLAALAQLAIRQAGESDSPRPVGAAVPLANGELFGCHNEDLGRSSCIAIASASDHAQLVRDFGSAAIAQLEESGLVLEEGLARAVRRTRVHAEVNLLASIAREGLRMAGSIAVSTLWPCSPCQAALAAGGVEELVVLFRPRLRYAANNGFPGLKLSLYSGSLGRQ